MPRSKPDPVKAAADRATLTAAIRQRNATRLRPIEVREPTEEDSPNSGGVVVEFMLNEAMSTSTSIDLNRREAAVLLDKLAAFLYGVDVTPIYGVRYAPEEDDTEEPYTRTMPDLAVARHKASPAYGDTVVTARPGYRIPRSEWQEVTDA